MSTEISARNLSDPYRYDYKAQIAKDLGLNTNSNLSLWYEKVQVVLNEAVVHSFSSKKVSIVD
jgi:nitric-oxide synthase